MAHRELVHKYANWLNDANRRIMELETTVADTQECLAQAQAAGRPPPGAAVVDCAAIQQKLDTSSRCATQPQVTIARQQRELQISKENAQTISANADAAIKKLTEQLTAAKASDPQQSGGGHAVAERLLLEKRAADERAAELEGRNAALLLSVDLRENTMKAQNIRIEEFSAQVTAMQGQEDGLRKEVEGLRATAGTLHAELAKQPTFRAQDVPAKGAKKGGKRNFVPDLAIYHEVAGLKRNLDLEKKRRLEAEVLLGPDGKRCKKCNPIVVDLGDDEDEVAAVPS
ncbi:hypothetical protein LTR85_008081 [Meristemomyces frigidus]|nr:hypothetical protein LTR85_008081 [Meristemomyces frigidus]